MDRGQPVGRWWSSGPGWLGWVRARWLPILLGLWLGTGNQGRAHTLPISYLTIVPDSNYLHLELVLNPFELNFFNELDSDQDGRLGPAELRSADRAMTDRLLGCLSLRVKGAPVAAEVAGINPDLDTHHVTLRAHYPVDVTLLPLTVESRLAAVTSGSHITQVTYGLGEGRKAARLDMQSPQITFDPSAAPARSDLAPNLEPEGERRFGGFELAAAGGLGVALVAWWWLGRTRQKDLPT